LLNETVVYSYNTNDTSETTDSLFSTCLADVPPIRLDDVEEDLKVGTVVGLILVRNEARTFVVSPPGVVVCSSSGVVSTNVGRRDIGFIMVMD
jgi:hypothetical protein